MTAKEPPKGGNQDIGYILIIVVTVTFIPAFIAVFLRIYTRAKIVRSSGWDDFLMIPAIVSHSTLFQVVFTILISSSR